MRVHLLPSSALDMAPRWFLNKWGVLDFAGGAVVHISAGFASLAGAIYLGKRKFKHLKSYNTSYVLLGTGMLWFGWFGFNSGSALGANECHLGICNNEYSISNMYDYMVGDGRD